MREPQLLHKLKDYGYHLVAPRAVTNEIENGQKSTWSILQRAIKDRQVKIMEVSSSQVLALNKRYPNLDAGEIQVLILGAEMKKRKCDYKCVLDEGPARKIANRHQISKTGTIGLLDVLNDLGIINKKKKENLLNALKRSRFRIKDSLISAKR